MKYDNVRVIYVRIYLPISNLKAVGVYNYVSQQCYTLNFLSFSIDSTTFIQKGSSSDGRFRK